jgi:hypothetical protein
MERMDMRSRNQYPKVLRKRYLKAGTKKEKTQILDEYCLNTGQSGKYVIRMIGAVVDLRPKQRKKGRETYDGEDMGDFDYPCGQRLKPILEVEVDRLRELGELDISDEVAMKLKSMSSVLNDLTRHVSAIAPA